MISSATAGNAVFWTLISTAIPVASRLDSANMLLNASVKSVAVDRSSAGMVGRLVQFSQH